MCCGNGVVRRSIYRCDCTDFGWTIARAAKDHAKYMERKPPEQTCLIKAGPDQPQTDTPNCVHLTGHASSHSICLVYTNAFYFLSSFHFFTFPNKVLPVKS
jgi:hypothetical protein